MLRTLLSLRKEAEGVTEEIDEVPIVDIYRSLSYYASAQGVRFGFHGGNAIAFHA